MIETAILITGAAGSYKIMKMIFNACRNAGPFSIPSSASLPLEPEPDEEYEPVSVLPRESLDVYNLSELQEVLPPVTDNKRTALRLVAPVRVEPEIEFFDANGIKYEPPVIVRGENLYGDESFL